MCHRLLECTWELGKAENHAGTKTSEEDQVDNVEDGTDGDKTRKAMGLNGDERRDTASSHRQRVPGPCEVLQPLTEGHPRLVGIFLVGIMGLHCCLLLLNVDRVSRGLVGCWLYRSFRHECRVLEGVLAFDIFGIAVYVDWALEVALLLAGTETLELLYLVWWCVLTSRRLHPCVRP